MQVDVNKSKETTLNQLLTVAFWAAITTRSDWSKGRWSNPTTALPSPAAGPSTCRCPLQPGPRRPLGAQAPRRCRWPRKRANRAMWMHKINDVWWFMMCIDSVVVKRRGQILVAKAWELSRILQQEGSLRWCWLRRTTHGFDIYIYIFGQRRFVRPCCHRPCWSKIINDPGKTI